MSHIEWEIGNASRLIGFKVVTVLRTNNGESFGLKLKKGKETLSVWVDCDPEGNGPGHLHIEDEAKK